MSTICLKLLENVFHQVVFINTFVKQKLLDRPVSIESTFCSASAMLENRKLFRGEEKVHITLMKPALLFRKISNYKFSIYCTFITHYFQNKFTKQRIERERERERESNVKTKYL